MFRWIQVTQEEAQELEENSIIQKGVGYRYNQPGMGHRMVGSQNGRVSCGYL
jgi:hypothetical protein